MRLFRRAWPYVILGLLVGINVFVWTQRQGIADWWRLRDYSPSSDIAALVTDDRMTNYAKKLFYINHPSLEDKGSFNSHCAEKGEETSVLGCYHGDRQGIFIFAVTDARLQGVRQVTAAHEMLHQAYDRLDEGERTRVNGLLQQYYDSGLTSPDIREKIDSYKGQKDAVLVNEMHSIFGSEVRDLPAELEAYYKPYFTDRLAVVKFSEAYRGEFTRRQVLIQEYDSKLTALKSQISSNKSTLEAKMNFLKTKEREIDEDISGRNQAAYESDVRDYNSTVVAYNALLTATRRLIEDHNDIVNKRNDIAVQEQQLQQALDSRLNTPDVKQ